MAWAKPCCLRNAATRRLRPRRSEKRSPRFATACRRRSRIRRSSASRCPRRARSADGPRQSARAFRLPPRHALVPRAGTAGESSRRGVGLRQEAVWIRSRSASSCRPTGRGVAGAESARAPAEQYALGERREQLAGLFLVGPGPRQVVGLGFIDGLGVLREIRDLFPLANVRVVAVINAAAHVARLSRDRLGCRRGHVARLDAGLFGHVVTCRKEQQCPEARRRSSSLHHGTTSTRRAPLSFSSFAASSST